MRILALILAACAATTLDWSSVQAAVHGPPSAAPAETRLIHISIVKTGSGPSIVLIPGLSTPRDVWSAFAPDLAKAHTVYSVQINGFAGDSPGAPVGEAILAKATEELHAFLASERAGPTRFVGHSLGGLLAMKVAADHPGDVSALMIVDSLPFAGVMFDEKATPEAVRPLAAMLKTRMEAGYSGPQGDAAATATADGLTAKPGSAALVKSWIMKADPKVAAAAMAEDLITDMRPRIGNLTVPITVVHPAEALGKDAGATAAFYRAQYTGASNAKFEAVKDSGHFIMLDQPERFEELLAAFAK